MNTWRIVDEQAIINRLKELPRSLAARYRSSQSSGLGRGGCTPNTRVAIQEQLQQWSYDVQSEKIFWLNGMAGTGKTTIAYSLCEHLDGALMLAGSFFCSRQLPDCREVNRIFPSIAYQLALFSPPFRYALSRVLERDLEAYNQLLADQFKVLILDPLRQVKETLSGDLIVVIDALDECEDVNGIDMILSALLLNASELPIKFLVTGRPEPKIYDRMQGRQGERTRFELYLHDLDRSVVQEDIRRYLETSLRSISLDPNQMNCLAERSGVLFIYAATAVRYIAEENFSWSTGRVNMILNTPMVSPTLAAKDMDILYTAILNAAFSSVAREPSEKELMRYVLRTVICAQEPLTAQVLAGLLGHGSIHMMQAALRPFLSVLNVSKNDKLITTLHESFPDFMLEATRSGPFHCNPREYHGVLAQTCFDLMRAPEPPFNVCGLESSYMFDKDVPNLEERINKAISKELLYACRYWGDHTMLGSPTNNLFKALDDFLTQRLLLWMEILNLTSSLLAGAKVLGQLGSWCKKSNCSEYAKDLIEDAWKFVASTRSSSLIQSTPHIYISLFVFWPKGRPMSITYQDRLQNLPKTPGTGLEHRNGTLLTVYKIDQHARGTIYSPDGTRLAYIRKFFTFGGSVHHNYTIWLIDARTGETAEKPLSGHTDIVSSIAYSPDGTRIVSGSHDRTIRIWDAYTGEMMGKSIEGHTDLVTSVAYSPNGTHIASGSRDCTIRIWDVYAGEMIKTLLGCHTESVNRVAYSPDGTRIVSGSRDRTICIWDVDAGQMVGEPLNGHTGSIETVAYSPDGTRVVSGSRDATIRIWDAKTRRVIGNPLEKHTLSVNSVAYSPDGTRIVSGSDDCTIRIWNADTGQMIGEAIEGHMGLVSTVSYSPDSTSIVSDSGDGTIRIWDVNTFHIARKPLEGHTGPVNTIAYSPDGTRFVSGSDDCTIRIWDANNGEAVKKPLMGHMGSVNMVAYSPDCTRVVSGSDDGTIRIWDARTGGNIGSPLEGHADPVKSVAYSPDGTRIISGSYNCVICIWDGDTGVIVDKFPDDHAISAVPVAYSSDGTHIIAKYVDDSIRILDVHTGETVGKPLERHANLFSPVAYSPDGTRIVSWASDKTIRIWDTRTGEVTGSPLEGDTSSIGPVAYSPDGTHIVSGSWDKTIRIWDAYTGEMIGRVLEGHTNRVKSVAYSPDGTRIVSGSSDHTIRIWDANSNNTSFDDSQDSSIMLPSDLTSPNTFRTDPHTNWVLKRDGWVVGDDSKPLIWIPVELRNILMSPRNTRLISRHGSFSLDFSKAALGESWGHCYKPQ